MQPTPRTTRFAGLTFATLIGGALAFASAAEAGHRGEAVHLSKSNVRNERVQDVNRRGDQRRGRVSLSEARRFDKRLDRRGEAIDRHLDFLAVVAALSGEHRLARQLDQKGDRIERRLDRRGDRVLRDAREQRRAKAHRKDRRRERKRERWRERDEERKREQWGERDEERGSRFEYRAPSSRKERLGSQRRQPQELDQEDAFLRHWHLGR